MMSTIELGGAHLAGESSVTSQMDETAVHNTIEHIHDRNTSPIASFAEIPTSPSFPVFGSLKNNSVVPFNETPAKAAGTTSEEIPETLHVERP